MAGDLKKQALSGLLWTGAERFGAQLVSLCVGIVVARLLEPADFGLIGMTAIFLAVSQTLIDSGFGSALIQNKNRNETDYSTCFYFNAALGLAVYSILFACAPLIANFYQTPQLCPVVRVVALALVIDSLSISQTSRLTAELRFKQLSAATLVAKLVSGAAAVAIAYSGWGVWALAWQGVGAALLRLTGLEIATKWRPRAVFSRAAFRQMFGFGSKIVCSSLINTLYNNLYTLVIGKAFSPVEVGHYNKALEFPQLPTQSVLQVVMKVAYPLMSEMQNNDGALRDAYRKFLRLATFVLYPVLAMLIALAEPLIELLIGAKWLPCVPLLQVLAFVYIFDPLTHINLNVLYVKGRTDLVLKLELIKKPIAFGILFATLPLGLWWLCAGKAVYGLVAYAFNCHYTGKMIGLGFWRQMVFCAPVTLTAAAAGASAYASGLAFSAPAAKLAAGAAAGGLVYLGLTWLLKDESLESLIALLPQREQRLKKR